MPEEVSEGVSGDADRDVSREKSDSRRVEEAREEVRDFLEGLLDNMGVEGNVEVRTVASESIEAAITGSEAGTLIGRKGKTLDSVQELARAVVQRQVGFGIKVAVDVEGYRERRRLTLESLTEDMVQEAKDLGEAELEPMSAYERKIVHDLVADHDEVTSFSEGEGSDRRVIIRRAEPERDEGEPPA